MIITRSPAVARCGDTTMSLPAPAPYRLTFGRFKGSTLAECNEDYLLWLSDFAPSPALRLLARKHLGIDVVVQEDESILNESAAVRFPLVCFQWEQEMTARYGADPTTAVGAVVVHGRAVLRKLCSEVTGRPWPEAAGNGRFQQEGGAV